MRDLHEKMLAALIEGDGLEEVAGLAATEAGTPVAIVIPSRGVAVASVGDLDLAALSAWVSARLVGAKFDPAAGVDLELPVVVGDAPVGYTLALAPESRNGLPQVELDRVEILRTTALATLTALAVTDARDELAAEVRGSFLEELCAQRLEGPETMRRAARLGCDLRGGAVALVAEVRTARPRHVAAMITGEHRGAIAEPLVDPEGDATRVYALLPTQAADSGEKAAATLASARLIAARLRPHGPAAFSSFCENAADLGRAVLEAELMLGVVARDERLASQLGSGTGDGVYRLLFRALASDPDEVRRFYEETVEPLVGHDREYKTDLLGTLEAYLTEDCNMNATARAVFAHRHTVAHRLGRIKELCGLDPATGEDRERLGLGIKAYRILEPTLSK